MAIDHLTATELIDHYKDRTLSPVEVTDKLFQHIHNQNPDLNAFVTLNEEAARRKAKKAEEAYRTGKNIGALEGVPIAIKDLTNTKGLRTTYGSPLYKNHMPDRDATVVKRLKAAGAIIMGKTNSPEFGYKATTDNPLFGATRNPWQLDTNAGGSSGGSASAVAAGLVPLAEGSDGGGSIRIPAALCGVYGFKPTYGRVPYDNHLDGLFGTHEPFLHYGTLSRSAKDTALMYDVIKGYAANDPFALPDNGVSASDTLDHAFNRPLKIGWTLDFGMYEVDTQVATVFRQAIDRLKSSGMNIEEVQVDFKMTLNAYIDFFERLWTAGLAADLQNAAREHPEAFSKGLLDMIDRGSQLSAVEFKRLEKTRADVWHHMLGIFSNYDLLLSPTLATPAFHWEWDGPPTINGKPIKADADWVMTQVYNLTGTPAISIPIGLTAGGLPVGLQAAAGRLQDEFLLRFAYFYEQNFPTLSSVNSR